MPLVNVLINSTTAGNGNGKVKRGNAPAPILLDYLAVGGGGSSDNNGNAGGGGGVISGSIRFLPRFTLDVTVGNGGTGSNSTPAQPSSLNVINPQGEFYVYAGGGTSNATSGEPQNNPAGTAINNYSKAGAGGSSQIGQNSTNNGAYGGIGGSGSVWALDSGSATYGGGGGGFGTFFIPGEARGGAGGIGGGGTGASAAGSGTNGLANLGGGGGGSQPGYVSNGGSGIVKLRYISGSVMGATGGTISVSGSYVYHTFTGSGQFVYQP
jgi:hypothetical protein